MKQWERLALLFSEQQLHRLKQATVLVIGLGGVGGYAVEALVRSGVGKLILVDADQYDETNLNRQLLATHHTIGKQKTAVWEEHIHTINPACEVVVINQFITKDNIELLFGVDLNYFIDACDTLETKKEIIRNCIKRKIPMILSMGMGNKVNPSEVRVMDIKKTTYDPIARHIRKMVKDEHIKGMIPVVCSIEKPIKTFKKEIGSCMFVPAIAGMLCASYVVDHIRKNEGLYEK